MQIEFTFYKVSTSVYFYTLAQSSLSLSVTWGIYMFSSMTMLNYCAEIGYVHKQYLTLQ